MYQIGFLKGSTGDLNTHISNNIAGEKEPSTAKVDGDDSNSGIRVLLR